jgi:hypothetical protein
LFKGSHDACIEYARSRGFSAQLKELLTMSKRFEDLANVHLEEGALVEGVHCLLQHSRKSSTIERAKQLVVEYLWSNFGLYAVPEASAQKQAPELISIYSSLVHDLSSRHDVRFVTTTSCSI